MLNTFAKKAQPSGGENTAGCFSLKLQIFKSIDSFFDEEKTLGRDQLFTTKDQRIKFPKVMIIRHYHMTERG